MLANAKVEDVKLYMCNNPFFNRYPNSAALNVYFLEQQELDKELSGAEELQCDGKNIIREKK